jgi:hypothetical protein
MQYLVHYTTELGYTRRSVMELSPNKELAEKQADTKLTSLGLRFFKLQKQTEQQQPLELN